MAVFHATVKSREILTETELTVILPQDFSAAPEKPLRTLYLLHGMGRGHACWLHASRIEQYARRYRMAVVMPEVRRNFYCDMVYGRKLFSWVAKELPGLMQRTLHLPAERENTYIAGRSVGGYGALKCAFTYPGQYAGAASLSGTVNLAASLPVLMDLGIMTEDEIKGNLGDDMAVSAENDVLALSRGASGMKVFQSCGDADFLLEISRAVRPVLENGAFDYRYEELPGAHDAACFDASLARALGFFFGEDEKE